MDAAGRIWFCDPDFYPVARADEAELAKAKIDPDWIPTVGLATDEADQLIEAADMHSITAVTAAAAFGFHPSAEVIGLPRPGPVSRCAG